MIRDGFSGFTARIAWIRRTTMRSRFWFPLLVLALSVWSPVWGQGARLQSAPRNGGDFSDNMLPQTKEPAGVILMKGAWSSASDSITPLPEGGNVINNVFSDQYFGMTYSLPSDWTEKYKGPPPSDRGRYVLAEIGPANTSNESIRGSILITAQDMFFTPLPVANALELVDYTKDHLQAEYRVELPPTEVEIASHSFRFFAYESPVAQLHWYVAATQIRCHAVEIVLTSRDTQLLEGLILDMNKMKLPAEGSPTGGVGGGAVPVCIKDYARDENIIARVNPVFTEHKFNPVPVRIIIDKEGKVKHIHVLSAFTDQTKAITDALGQWRFKQYKQDGQPIDVETGILFGRAPRTTAPQAPSAAIE